MERKAKGKERKWVTAKRVKLSRNERAQTADEDGRWRVKEGKEEGSISDSNGQGAAARSFHITTHRMHIYGGLQIHVLAKTDGQGQQASMEPSSIFGIGARQGPNLSRVSGVGE